MYMIYLGVKWGGEWEFGSELPLRVADFGVLHRNEMSGALSGLTRVRRFQQDDAHIFCMESQVADEVKSVLEFVEYAYKIFDFTFELELSTRPEKFLGEIETWNRAEQSLEDALNAFGKPWQVCHVLFPIQICELSSMF
jgi:threonyl-tRNA synthetase